MDNGVFDKANIPNNLQYKGDRPWVKFNKPKLNNWGLVLTKDVGGLTLVATWVRTDSFTEDRDIKDEA